MRYGIAAWQRAWAALAAPSGPRYSSETRDLRPLAAFTAKEPSPVSPLDITLDVVRFVAELLIGSSPLAG
jgi:hypothetical protein